MTDLRGWIERTVRTDVQARTAYAVADPGTAIRLNQMENPFGWPADLWRACMESLSGAEINRYPDAAGRELIAAIRAHDDLDDAWGVMLGNGSDEIIQPLIQAICDGARPVMAPAPSFVMFEVIAGQCRVPYVGVDLNRDFSLDADGLIAAMQRHNPALLFLAQPNNPTGNLYDEADLRRVIEACPGLVIIDEAYGPFSSRNHQSWLDQYPNLLVMRTFSKMGLAGLRCGYLVGDVAWIEQINKVRLPYNLGVLNQAVARFALTEGRAVLAQQSAALRVARDQLFDALSARGLRVHPSEANFMLLEVDQPSAVNASIAAQGVLIKDLSKAHPMLARCLRVSIGTDAENAAFLAALDVALKAQR
ncbi:histidinol-phosphate transaminase [Litorivicinus lipolyticus]|uniref:histidinol-phosphate transaminase n=1 Tax=Litorivicinus lipolyticus TaxID=418701 RepID=UPI003B5C79A0